MIVIKIQGGLGNQMFQYAFASILAKKNKSKLLIDDSIYTFTDKKTGFTPRKFELSIFDCEFCFAKSKDKLFFYNLSLINKIKKKLKLNYPKFYNEPEFEYSSKVNVLKYPIYFIGYFQSFKYFVGFEDYVRELFVFPTNKLSQKNKDLIPVLKNKNTIAVHIRRGDYISDPVTNQFHGSCSLEYYTKAIAIVSKTIAQPTLVFFSDDYQWVKENFEFLTADKIFVSHNIGGDSWVDMYLMSICSHNIIANSSFSWWGAWLNANPTKIVVAPKTWFQAKKVDINSIIPKEWITI